MSERQKMNEQKLVELEARAEAVRVNYQRLLPKAESLGLTITVQPTTSISLLDNSSVELLTERSEQTVCVPAVLLISRERDVITHVNTGVIVKEAGKDQFTICNAVLAYEGTKWQPKRSMVSYGVLSATQDEKASLTFHELAIKALKAHVEENQ